MRTRRPFVLSVIAVAAFSFALGGQVGGFPRTGGQRYALDPPNMLPDAPGESTMGAIAEVHVRDRPCAMSGGTMHDFHVAGEALLGNTAATDPGDGSFQFDIEIRSMELMGYSSGLSQVKITELPSTTPAAQGTITSYSVQTGGDFPAQTTFGMRFMIEWGQGALNTQGALPLTGDVHGYPPID